MTDSNRWLAEAVVTRDLDRVKPDMGAAGFRINDARSNAGGARQVKDTTPPSPPATTRRGRRSLRT
jgi:hypothetical protein